MFKSNGLKYKNNVLKFMPLRPDNKFYICTRSIVRKSIGGGGMILEVNPFPANPDYSRFKSVLLDN